MGKIFLQESAQWGSSVVQYEEKIPNFVTRERRQNFVKLSFKGAF